MPSPSNPWFGQPVPPVQPAPAQQSGPGAGTVVGVLAGLAGLAGIAAAAANSKSRPTGRGGFGGARKSGAAKGGKGCGCGR